MLSRLAKNLIEFYTTRLPYHRGKWRVTEALVRWAQLEEQDRGKTFVVDRSEVRWKLSTDCAVQRRLFYHGIFDIHDVREVMRRLDERGPESVFFDVGSYFGYYALLAARRTRGPVFAFEPVRPNYELLVENKALNGFAHLHAVNMAVSDAVGEVSFEVPSAENRGTGRIGGAGETVRATTLDSFVNEQRLARVDFIKIDVEGAEMKVLAGARAVLAKFHPAMLIEVNPPCLTRFGASEQDLLRMLREEFGYETFRATVRGLEPFERLRDNEAYANVFCLPKTLKQQLPA